MNSVVLNRQNVFDLIKVVERFPEVERFEITTDSSNGIGPVIKVKFTLFDYNITSVDITDVASW